MCPTLPSSAKSQAPAGQSIALLPSNTPTRHPPPKIGQIQARTQPIGTFIEQVKQIIKLVHDLFTTSSLLVHYLFMTYS